MARIAILISAAFALLYSGYWAVGAYALNRAIPAWADARRDEGWQVQWTEARVRGFPSRFDTTLVDPQFADPQTGWAWQGDFLQLLALSYRPNHLIAVLPPDHQLTTPQQRYAINQDRARASVVLTLEAQSQIDRVTVVIEAPRWDAPDWSTSAQSVRLATRRLPDSPLAHDLGVLAEAVVLPAALKLRLDPEGLLPAALDRLRLDATLGFDAPWDRRALENAPPRPTAVVLREARATWGRLDLRLSADLTVDEAGLVSGQMTLQAQNWREGLAVADRAGLMSPAMLPVLENAFASMAQASDGQAVLDIPLTLRAGRVSVGFVPIGQIPPLWRR